MYIRRKSPFPKILPLQTSSRIMRQDVNDLERVNLKTCMNLRRMGHNSPTTKIKKANFNIQRVFIIIWTASMINIFS